MFQHFITKTCNGEYCGHELQHGTCLEPATHKVGEEIPFDSRANDKNLPLKDRVLFQRHNFTMYVCCTCFGKIFGNAARKFCGLEN